MTLRYTTAAISFVVLAATHAQTDFAIAYDNYTPGQVFADDEIAPAFTVTNHGPETILAGDTVYLSVIINGMPFGLDLLGNYTGLELVNELPPHASFSFDPGVLSGSMTLMFFPGATSLEFCMTVWGKGLAAVDVVGGTFPLDTDPLNNSVCATFDPNATSIGEQNVLTAHLFPNPSTDAVEFMFRTSGMHDVLITDATGRVVLREQVTGTDRWRVDVRAYAPGSYAYTVRSGTDLAQGRFVKQ